MSVNFENLINKDKNQIFVLSCPASIPLSFARHTWFVISKNGILSRWEVLHFRNKNSGTYIHINLLPPLVGMRMIFGVKKIKWTGRVVGHAEGDTAEKLISIIEQSEENYPFTSIYSLSGPNSNTYAKWVLDQVPELNIKLPWNSFGKNYM